MKYFLGIDGGGTKTDFLLMDETGKTAARLQRQGCSYKDYGMEAVAGELKKGVLQCLEEAGTDAGDLLGIAVGLPCYGESRTQDVKSKEILNKTFGPIPLLITNDVEVGWAGSLGLKSGIHVVSGTGSIAFGRNSRRKSRRAGGWSPFFGDEGSCHWLGRRTMELFSKEADQRVARGPLYEIIRREFGLEEDMDFVDLMESSYVPSRSRVASLQKLLLMAARAGDENARDLYRQAAEELGKMIAAVATGIALPGEELFISYSGGLFHAGEYVLPYLKQYAKSCGGKLITPRFTPAQGAVLLCGEQFGPECLEEMIQNMENQKVKNQN